MRGHHDPEVLERIAVGYAAAIADTKRCKGCGLWRTTETCRRCQLNQHAESTKNRVRLYPLGQEHHRRRRGKAGLRQRASRLLHGTVPEK